MSLSRFGVFGWIDHKSLVYAYCAKEWVSIKSNYFHLLWLCMCHSPFSFEIWYVILICIHSTDFIQSITRYIYKRYSEHRMSINCYSEFVWWVWSYNELFWRNVVKHWRKLKRTVCDLHGNFIGLMGNLCDWESIFEICLWNGFSSSMDSVDGIKCIHFPFIHFNIIDMHQVDEWRQILIFLKISKCTWSNCRKGGFIFNRSQVQVETLLDWNDDLKAFTRKKGKSSAKAKMEQWIYTEFRVYKYIQ